MWLHSSVGRASHRHRGSHGFESRWSLDLFFQASSFQLLKLENLLRWSFFTLIYNRSSNTWVISYICHISLFNWYYNTCYGVALLVERDTTQLNWFFTFRVFRAKYNNVANSLTQVKISSTQLSLTKNCKTRLQVSVAQSVSAFGC